MIIFKPEYKFWSKLLRKFEIKCKKIESKSN